MHASASDDGSVAVSDVGDTRFVSHRILINGLRYHVVIAGSGPAVFFCHGFPDMWRVWRHQMHALARAGYMAIAPDLRGFGETEGPEEPTAYTALDVIGDAVGILDHFGLRQAVIVGHDWGAGASWGAPALRPDRFPAVATLSVPYTLRPPKSMPEMLVDSGLDDFYMVYFSRLGPADAELNADPENFVRRFFYTLSGDLPENEEPNLRLASTGRLIDSLAQPRGPMMWFDNDEIERYVANFRRRGFTSALNTYRSLRRSWELMATWADRKLEVPALFIYGDREIVMRFPGRADAAERFTTVVPKAQPPIKIAGAGHWVQLEAADNVNEALVKFLRSIPW